MPNNIENQRRHRPYNGVFGQPHDSPKKKRNYKNQKNVKAPLGFDRRQQLLLSKLKQCEDRSTKRKRDDAGEEEEKREREQDDEVWGDDRVMPGSGLSIPMDEFGPIDGPVPLPFTEPEMDWEEDDCAGHQPLPGTSAMDTEPSPSKSAKSSPSKSTRAEGLHTRWTALLPTLVPHYLSYCESTLGTPLSVPTDIQPNCSQNCSKKTYQIECLFFDHISKKDVTFCSCESVVPVLIRHGLFPGAPSQPRIAIAIAVLDFYQALFERSCDAINALVAALTSHYRRRGFPVRGANGGEVDDGFRKTVTEALCWYDHLNRLVDETVEQAIEAAGKYLEADAQPSVKLPEPTVSQYLKRKCPSCFGGKFGTPITKGCDVHVCVDGCFSHRRLKNAGNPPHPHVPEHYVSKAEVDAVGAHIATVRKKPAKPRKIVVPDEAIDECEDGHIAGTGTKTKTDTERYDDTGTMALVCRHDIPILLANIDTPGEQQKYAVALIKKLYSMLPPTATIAVFYDVGCVLDRSLQLYDILPTSITSRMTFATSAMHSYVHQWACQLAYNPRLQEGLGLSDGEGVERYWSRMRKIIGVCRTSGRTRRLWLIDRLTARIAAESRDNLGSWITRRFTDLDNRTAKYKLQLAECGIPEGELRDLWKEQRAAQLSVRAHAPSKLKKDLDKLIAIQGDLDRIENTIKEATASLGGGPTMASSLKALTDVYEELSTKLDALYASLNITDSFPALRGLPFDVVHKLLLARDLKINIRKRAIGSFFENERLEQASGGRNISLGTKEHQRVRTAIEKRKPSFLSAIRRFNKVCAELKELLKPEWRIPVPESLPTDIHKLRTKSHLMEDVWIERSVGETPRWIESPEVRQGIRALLSLDRCREELLRLGMESDNMCRWFGDELTKTELAIANPENVHIQRHLEAYRTRLLLTEPKWSSSRAVSRIRYQHHIENAQRRAQLVFNASPPGLQSTWLPVVKHDIKVVDFSRATFADDASGDESEGEGQKHESDDISGDNLDAFDLPDPGEFILRDILEDEAETSQPDELSTPLIYWVPPSPLTVDLSLIDSLRSPFIDNPPALHYFRHAKARPGTRDGSIEFCSPSLDRLSAASERLNDVCVNSGALLLQYIFSHDRFKQPHAKACAIFSSFDILSARFNRSIDHVWTRTKPTLYWEKAIWLLPIHRDQPFKHWVLCLIYPAQRRLYLYDSLAGNLSDWKADIQDVRLFLTKLALAAREHDKTFHEWNDQDEWVIQPLITAPVQTTTFSCGLWVLAAVAAILRGHHITGVSEGEIADFRTLLYKWSLTLPAK